MEELFGNPAYKGFVLQDKKRLPARFFARISRRTDQPTYLSLALGPAAYGFG